MSLLFTYSWLDFFLSRSILHSALFSITIISFSLSLLLCYFPMNPSISTYLLLYSFPHPFSSPIHSILVILVFVLRSSASLGLFENFYLLLFRFPFLRITLPFSFRILFVIPLETQRTPEGENPKYFSKLPGDVVLWECEWDSLTTEKVLWNQSSTRGSARTHLQPLHLSFLCQSSQLPPSQLHWRSKKMGEAAVISLLFPCTDCETVKLQQSGKNYSRMKQACGQTQGCSYHIY